MEVRRKGAIAALALFLLIPPVTGHAAYYRAASDTIIRSYQRHTSAGTDIDVMPVYEYLQVEMGDRGEYGLTVHAQGWLRSNLGDGGFFREEEDGELLYGYLEYTVELFDLRTRLGRMHVFEGPSNRNIDGLYVGGDILPQVSFSLFGGSPAPLEEDEGRDGDSIYGGKMAFHPDSRYNFGFSYVNVISNSVQDEETAGLDFYLTLPASVSVTGLSTYNILTDDWGQHFIEGRASWYEINFRPYMQKINYEDFFNTGDNSANPFRFLAGTEETLRIYGTDVSKQTMTGWDLGYRLKYYDYSRAGGNTLYNSGLVTRHFEGMSQTGLEIGLMDGDADQDQYLIGRWFAFWDSLGFDWGRPFVSGDVVFVSYKEEIQDEDSSLFVSAGCGLRFFDDALATRLSFDYNSDPFFDEEIRGMLVITYELKKGEEDVF